MNIYNALIYKKLYGGGGGGEIEVESLTATENKTYNAGEGKAYNPVVVAVPEPTLISKNITANGNYSASTDNADGYSSVSINVPLPSNAYLLQSIEHEQVASFSDGTDNFVKSLEVAIEPQQDLHGYNYPWVGGSGKNKLPLPIDYLKSKNTVGTWNNNVYSVNGLEFTILTDNNSNVIGINVHGQASANTSFSLIRNDELKDALSDSITYILNGCSGGSDSTYFIYAYHLNNSSGGITLTNGDSAFTWLGSSTDANITIQIKSGYNAQNIKFYPMIRLASVTDSTFAPYSNICPISGWSEANVTVADDVETPTVSNVYTIDLDGTRYGGKLDVVSGVLTLTDGFISSYNGETLPSTWISDRDVYAEGTTPTVGAQVVYKLATPITYQLTPTIIKSLQGENNLFASTGEIELLQYWSKEVTS